ncbi:MAG: UDP-N-acetylmuramoylalanine--D-glutamate ligase [Candidatus Woykebacteria bacterium RIFCSPLOWO2_01_FULL_43_14]|uniref:UDP-N-acetylmuramoylalanine--D-glutamate ligase n=1 Tax=Candidatus Woykebacteria bacterium RIFCSPLOWO2_01_FULL_43_14 TaxID=1802605 RepID=A0A1G1WSK3_9BACT|nr:MAG: UDP-N-acetylmuramoylalanine--D-glutamate ligase [Candidatus Woykebacteria bacterium RIFCSPLOWO2_01_FULL_43_14]
MKLEELRSRKRIILVGFGVEAKATLEYLAKFHPSSQVETTDEKDGPDYLEKQEDFDLAIRSPGVRKEFITIPYTTATNIFFANVTKPIIGVTGSKGKSTTASLIHEILSESNISSELLGNIGVPMLSSLLNPKEPDYYVCELSSFHLDDIQYSPHISVVTNLFPEHMDYHQDLDNYYQAKFNITKYQVEKDFFVYNPGYKLLVDWAMQTKAHQVPVTDSLPFTTSLIPLIGEHNVENVRTALTVANILKIPTSVQAKGVERFKPLPHRLEKVGTFKNLTFYDDAIATTPEATIEAIKALPKTSTIFLGGKDRGYDFHSLVNLVLDSPIKNIVLFPDSGTKIKESLDSHENIDKKIFATDSMEEAVRFAYQESPQGSVVLLSCASPSYSLWKNFEEKGDEFQKFVKRFGS